MRSFESIIEAKKAWNMLKPCQGLIVQNKLLSCCFRDFAVKKDGFLITESTYFFFRMSSGSRIFDTQDSFLRYHFYQYNIISI